MNLLSPLPDARGGEVFEDILRRPGCRVERIVSLGQVTPPARPYNQAHDEWVLVLAGDARVELGERVVPLAPGDHLLIPAGRVVFTDPDRPTVWLAVHIGEG